MSEVKVNKVSPRSGTTVTIGDSGDTINIVGTLQNNGSPLAGDISSVVAGTGLSGGATSGVATLNIEAAQPTITSLGTITGFTSTGIDDNATSTAITIDSSEQIGIGTSSPSRKLHVLGSAGTVQIQSTGTTSALYLADTNSSSIDNQGIGSNGNNIYAMAGGVERMRISSAGLVGIGTSTLLRTLNIYGASNGSIGLDNPVSGTPQIAFKQAGTDKAYLSYWDAYDTLSLSDGSGNGLHFSPSTQRVGIGTSSPASTLEISKSDRDNGCTLSITNSHIGTDWSSGDVIGTVNFRVDDTSTSQPIRGQIVSFDDGSGANSAAPNDSAMKFSTASSNTLSERMRITSSGNVLIGTTDAGYPVFGDNLTLKGSTHSGITIRSGTSSQGNLYFSDATGTGTGTYAGAISYLHSSDAMVFRSNSTQRMRIDSSGNVLIKKTTSGFNTAGFEVKSGDEPIYVTTENNYNLLVNRKSSDGDLIRFYRSTSQKGSITVSGETVSYNAFTGSHWSRFTDNSKPTILRGTVLETLDEMLDWYNLEYNITTTTKDEDGNDVTNTETFGVPHVLTDSQSVGDVITYNHEGTDYQATIVKEADVKHMMSKVSDTTDAKNVYGVFNCYDEEQSEEGYNDFLVASVGSFVVRIKANETIAKGDLLQSNGDGTAKVQTDDAVRSSSFAKVLSTTIIETYEDGSYLVPCSLMC